MELKGSVFYSSIKLILTEDKLDLIFLGKKPSQQFLVLIEKLIFLVVCLMSHLLTVTKNALIQTTTFSLPCPLTAQALLSLQ